MTLFEIGTAAKLIDRKLIVPNSTVGREDTEISVVYLRAGYGPEDYPSHTEWDARRLLELSRANKCPTIISQTTCKKVQQVLTMPGILEKYAPGGRRIT